MILQTQATGTLTFKQPPGLWVIAICAALLSIGFGTINSLLVLYATSVIKLDTSRAYLLYATYNSLLFTLPLFGGYIAEKLGYRKSFLFGFSLLIIGLFMLSHPTQEAMYLGLGFFSTGVSLTVPCYLVLQGKLYAKEDHRRDSAFTLSYIIMNIGFLIAGASSGFLAQNLGYSKTFLLAMVVMICFYFVYFYGRKYIVPYGTRSIGKQVSWNHTLCWGVLVAASALVIIISTFLVSHAKQNTEMLVILVLGATSLIVYSAFKRKDILEKQKLLGFIILSYISIGFWALYTLEPSLLTLFIKTNVNRTIFGITIPPSTYYALDPLYVIVLGALFSMLWIALAKRNKYVSLPAKFTTSLFAMGCGFLLLIVGILLANKMGLSSMIWIVVVYAFLASGELLISPIGNAMVGRLSPEGMEGRLMGVWQLFTGFAGALSGYLAQFAVVPSDANPLQTNPVYITAFAKIGLMSIGLGVISLLLVPYVKKLIQPKNVK